jgi:hypothetical protein
MPGKPAARPSGRADYHSEIGNSEMNFDDLGSDFELAPEGPHTAVLVSWIDRGLQQGRFGARCQAGARFELVNAEKKLATSRSWFSTRSSTFR